MNESKFNMWRACVAVVHLDKKVISEERVWCEEKIKTLPLTDEQRNILKNDLENGIKLSSVVPKITDKVDRGFLMSIFLVLGHLDCDFSPAEKEQYKKLESEILLNLNLKTLEEGVKLAEMNSYHEDEVYKNVNRHSFFEKMFNAFLKQINPGDYKFPKK